jgi:predicted ArsR family transcriptional regulator
MTWGKRAEAIPEHDMFPSQILAYLAEHDHATQMDVAQALGISVRTVQRKLAAWKHQQSGN